MSLKAFHIFFITASSAIAAGFGIWSLKTYFAEEGGVSLIWLGIGSLVASVGLIVYGRYFLKKLKDVSYL